MLKRLVWIGCALLSLMVLPASATDIVLPGGGVLAQIASGGTGGTWSTTITLVNLSGVAAPWELHFVSDDGEPMSIPTSIGTGSVLTGVLNSAGSVIIETTAAPDTPQQQGWAYVLTTPTVTLAGSAVFRRTLPSAPEFEASLPLDTDAHIQFGLPFVHIGATTGFALVNSYSTSPTTITLTFYDESGTQFFTDTFSMPGLSHQAFMLPDRYPEVAGKNGVVVITADYYVNVLGLRGRGQGFTTITPLVIQGW